MIIGTIDRILHAWRRARLTRWERRALPWLGLATVIVIAVVILVEACAGPPYRARWARTPSVTVDPACDVDLWRAGAAMVREYDSIGVPIAGLVDERRGDDVVVVAHRPDWAQHRLGARVWHLDGRIERVVIYGCHEAVRPEQAAHEIGHAVGMTHSHPAPWMAP